MRDWNEIFIQGKTTKYEPEKVLKNMNFQKKFKIFNVVGTNGKGSVSNYLAQGLQICYSKVGLFTSPHLQKPNERISINGSEISNEDFFSIYDELIVHGIDQVIFFAALFLVAIVYFNRQNCDFVVMEAGIGGKLDTTNLLDGEYGVVTSIDFDHTEILGETLEKIATDKAGIINPGMTFFVPNTLDPKLATIFKNYAQNTGTKTICIDATGSNYQESNQKLATNILKNLGIHFTEFKTPLGRTQVIKNNGFLTILDVGHNEHGIRASLQLLVEKKIEYSQVVLMMKKDKDASKILPLFQSKKVYFYQKDANFHRFENVEEIKNLQNFYAQQDKNTLYIGSFFLIAELLR